MDTTLNEESNTFNNQNPYTAIPMIPENPVVKNGSPIIPDVNDPSFLDMMTSRFDDVALLIGKTLTEDLPATADIIINQIEFPYVKKVLSGEVSATQIAQDINDAVQVYNEAGMSYFAHLRIYDPVKFADTYVEFLVFPFRNNIIKAIAGLTTATLLKNPQYLKPIAATIAAKKMYIIGKNRNFNYKDIPSIIPLLEIPTLLNKIYSYISSVTGIPEEKIKSEIETVINDLGLIKDIENMKSPDLVKYASYLLNRYVIKDIGLFNKQVFNPSTTTREQSQPPNVPSKTYQAHPEDIPVLSNQLQTQQGSKYVQGARIPDTSNRVTESMSVYLDRPRGLRYASPPPIIFGKSEITQKEVTENAELIGSKTPLTKPPKKKVVRKRRNVK